MIVGESSEEGAFLTAKLHFEAIPETVDVSFLVDTGATLSTLLPADLALLGAFAQARLSSQLRPGVPLQGVGGYVPTYSSRALIEFRHTDGRSSIFRTELLLVVDNRYLGVPSILGRDILFRGQLSIGRLGLTWDVEPGEHDRTG